MNNSRDLYDLSLTPDQNKCRQYEFSPNCTFSTDSGANTYLTEKYSIRDAMTTNSEYETSIKINKIPITRFEICDFCN